MQEDTFFREPPDFSLVLGGLAFQALLRAHLSGEALELLRRRLIVISLFAWLPLLMLSMAAGGGKMSFLRDIEVHVRFLIALPVLVAAEVFVHSRIRPAVQLFVQRRIVRTQDLPKFHSAMESALRIRNSIPVEVGLFLFVYTAGLWVWRHYVALDVSTWYAIVENGHSHLTPAGRWYAFVSIPIFQFIIIRWYLRLFIWFRFLWQVSRFKLHLIPTHPDRAAGLAFLGKSAYAFAPILFAQGTLLSALIAGRVLYEGHSLLSYKMQALGFVLLFVFAVLGPLLMFTPQLARAQRKGRSDYGLLAQRYVEGFENKWIMRNEPPPDELLGTGDIQSLADLGNSYGLVREMRIVPFGVEDMTRLAAATAVPLVPLLLLIVSFEELVIQIIKILF